ncbi:hypothetical protein GJ744_004410 [Endocarpon pusillum]|uniref:Uncharacterized protein n=1 Tax=Endocarpon pusillum TaxID=364733 RepID=A0A8H7AZP5_9EURO|nr:hypothetical protein GJ744_004410 [Endocarpon pusillum]
MHEQKSVSLGSTESKSLLYDVAEVPKVELDVEYSSVQPHFIDGPFTKCREAEAESARQESLVDKIPNEVRIRELGCEEKKTLDSLAVNVEPDPPPCAARRNFSGMTSQQERIVRWQK